jgi:hypothetical protein
MRSKVTTISVSPLSRKLGHTPAALAVGEGASAFVEYVGAGSPGLPQRLFDDILGHTPDATGGAAPAGISEPLRLRLDHQGPVEPDEDVDLTRSGRRARVVALGAYQLITEHRAERRGDNTLVTILAMVEVCLKRARRLDAGFFAQAEVHCSGERPRVGDEEDPSSEVDAGTAPEEVLVGRLPEARLGPEGGGEEGEHGGDLLGGHSGVGGDSCRLPQPGSVQGGAELTHGLGRPPRIGDPFDLHPPEKTVSSLLRNSGQAADDPNYVSRVEADHSPVEGAVTFEDLGVDFL